MYIQPIKYKGIPIYFNFMVENAGGSIIIPLPLTHNIYPLVLPEGSNPWEHPKIVIPKAGGLKSDSI